MSTTRDEVMDLFREAIDTANREHSISKQELIYLFEEVQSDLETWVQAFQEELKAEGAEE